MDSYQEALKAKWDERIERLKNMPELPGAAYRVGCSYLKRDFQEFFEEPNYEEAIKWFVRAIEDRKDTISNMKAPVGKELEWDLAYALMMPSKKRNLKLASSIMAKLTPYFPGFPDQERKLARQKGLCLLMLRKYDEAEKYFNELGWGWQSEVYRTLLWKYNGDVDHPEIAKRHFDMKSCLPVFLNYVIGKTSVEDRLDIIATYYPKKKGLLYPSGLNSELREMYEICLAKTGNKEIIKQYDERFNCVKKEEGPRKIYKYRESLRSNEEFFVASFLLAKGIIQKRWLNKHGFEHPTDVWRALARRGHPISMLSLAKFGEDREYWEANAHLYGGPKLWSISM